MKNLLTSMTLQELQNVTSEGLASIAKYESYRDRWGSKRNDCHKVNNVHPYDRAKRVAMNNIGKSFDMAFHYYCKISPKYQQRWFLELFEGNRRQLYGTFTVDDAGNIKLAPSQYSKESKPIVFSTTDFKVEWKHKVTGHLFDEFDKVYPEGIEKVYGVKPLYLERKCIVKRHPKYRFLDVKKLLPAWKIYKAQESDFERVIVSGEEFIFESRNDPRCKRMSQNCRRQKEKERRDSEKNMETRWEEALRILKEKKQKMKEENEQNILAHGFDLKTSFRK